MAAKSVKPKVKSKKKKVVSSKKKVVTKAKATTKLKKKVVKSAVKATVSKVAKPIATVPKLPIAKVSKPAAKKPVAKVATKKKVAVSKKVATPKPKNVVAKTTTTNNAPIKAEVKKAPAKVTNHKPITKTPDTKPKLVSAGNAKNTIKPSPIKKTVKTEGWIEQNRLMIIVIFVAVVIMNVWVYITTPRYTPHISEQEIVNPVFDGNGAYYKYNIPESEWNNFNGKKAIENLVASGIIFDEATYQNGGQTCDACPTKASPLLYIKNPNYILGGNWQRVDKPGYYENTQQYIINQYLLSY